jgi:hypothetical protein
MIGAGFTMILRMERRVVLFALTFSQGELIFFRLTLSLISISLVSLKLIYTELAGLADSVTLG